MIFSKNIKSSNIVRGNLDEIRDDLLHGWLYSAFPAIKPVCFVDTVPATLVSSTVSRPDVSESLGTPDSVGFIFHLPKVSASSVVSLYCVSNEEAFFVESKKFGTLVCENNVLSQIQEAAKIAQKKDAVAVVCWDGAHNPIGRAKVLYDILATHRPVVLFCWVHEEFGGNLWKPLCNSAISLVAIPWQYRRKIVPLFQEYGLKFNTVWISKPRLPSFLLASAVSHPETRFILDIDDNEESFIKTQEQSCAAYDSLGLTLCNDLLCSVSSRTVVSPPLQKKFGGIFVRHARKVGIERKARSGEAYKIAFIGTVRKHKNLLAIAKAFQCVRFSYHLPLELHVYGDIEPPEYRTTLEENGAVLRPMLPANNLPDILSEMDAVITGFPNNTDQEINQEILESQVPAKISDALAAGLPVLTPKTPAVADLVDIPGVFVFTEENFVNCLVAALKQKTPLTLPQDFTLEGAYEAFDKAEKSALPAPVIQNLLPFSEGNEDSTQALILIWKQQDAGLYGRRIDQIARSYKRFFPNHKVFILEFFCTNTLPKALSSSTTIFPEAENFSDEQPLKYDFLTEKQYGLECHGVTLKTFFYSTEKGLQNDFFFFLTSHHLRPNNSLLILFPIIQEWRLVEEILRPYHRIIDIVDNQMSWAKNEERGSFVMEQYFRLLAPADYVVFNTENPRIFFKDRHFLDAVPNVHLISNWYTLPENVVLHRQPLLEKTTSIFYSGNMNDRFDWNLLHFLANQQNIHLHLAGSAQRVTEKLRDLLMYKNVSYHGVITEQETLAWLQAMDMAIVPHILDNVSTFMNPIKIQMYLAIHLPTLCPEWLFPEEKSLLHYHNSQDCLEKILSEKTTKTSQTEQMETPVDSSEKAYMNLLEEARKALSNLLDKA